MGFGAVGVIEAGWSHQWDLIQLLPDFRGGMGPGPLSLTIPPGIHESLPWGRRSFLLSLTSVK